MLMQERLVELPVHGLADFMNRGVRHQAERSWAAQRLRSRDTDDHDLCAERACELSCTRQRVFCGAADVVAGETVSTRVQRAFRIAAMRSYLSIFERPGMSGFLAISSSCWRLRSSSACLSNPHAPMRVP